jgi:hypothetical protein
MAATSQSFAQGVRRATEKIRMNSRRLIASPEAHDKHRSRLLNGRLAGDASGLSVLVCLAGVGSERQLQQPEQNVCTNRERPPQGRFSVSEVDVRY